MTPVPCGWGCASAVEANAEGSTTNKATTRCAIGRKRRHQSKKRRRFNVPGRLPVRMGLNRGLPFNDFAGNARPRAPRDEVPRPGACRTYRSDEIAMDQIFAPGAKDVVCRSPGRKTPVWSSRNVNAWGCRAKVTYSRPSARAQNAITTSVPAVRAQVVEATEGGADEQGRLTCRCARAPPGESREAAGPPARH